MYLLFKIHQHLINVPGHPVIWNCGTPSEKASEFLDHHLQPIMRSDVCYIEDTNDFREVPDNAILVTESVSKKGTNSALDLVKMHWWQLIKMNLMISWNNQTIFILIYTWEFQRGNQFPLMLLLELIKVNLSPISTANIQMASSTFSLSHVILVTQDLHSF